MWIIIDFILDIIFPKNCFGCGVKKTFLCQKCQKQIPCSQLNTSDNKIFAVASYKSKVIKKTIHALKYKKAKQVAKPLAELIYSRLNFNYRDRISIIVPVPLSRKSLRKRGFNQAELIAKHLSDIISFRIITNVLYKNHHTLSQVEIKNRQERLENLKGVFSTKNTYLIKNQNILLIDDVSTTGATINECRKVLKKAGAKKVTGLVVAKG